MPRKHDVIDELIKDELREFLLWLREKKFLELCEEDYIFDETLEDEIASYWPVHKAPEDLINEYMEIE